MREVDGKLVRLAQQMDCPIADQRLQPEPRGRAAGRAGAQHQRAGQRVKAVVLPGESCGCSIIQEGKEHGQGVGYLDDGTMIVVEDGRRLHGTEVDIMVTRVLQTVAGRMIFGQIQEVKHRGAN